jgi:hypothetical protein
MMMMQNPNAVGDVAYIARFLEYLPLDAHIHFLSL